MPDVFDEVSAAPKTDIFDEVGQPSEPAARALKKEALGKEMAGLRRERFLGEQEQAALGAAEDIAKVASIPAQPILKLPRSQGTGVGAGLLNIGAGLAEGVSAPAYWLMPYGKPLQALAGGQIAGNIPESTVAAVQALRDPNATVAQKLEAGAQPILETAIGAGIAGARLRKGTPDATSKLSEPVSLPTERAGDDARRTPAETGVGGRLQPAAQGPPEATGEAKAPNVVFDPSKTGPIEAAAYKDPKTGIVTYGKNHPEILAKLGIEGFDTPESRNTPDFGYKTFNEPFVPREKSGPIAEHWTQDLKDFDPEQPHSNQISAVPGGTVPLSESKEAPAGQAGVPPPTAPATVEAKAGEVAPSPAGPAITEPSPAKPTGQEPSVTPPVTEPPTTSVEGPPVIQAGAAHITEIPITGAGGEKYGVRAVTRAERAQAGQVEPVPPGTGTSPESQVLKYREIVRADPTAGPRLLEAFEADPKKQISAELEGVTRAHGEALFAGARTIEEQFGTDSPQWKEANRVANDWDKRTKPIQTEWSEIGRGQQGETDIDTGSFTGLNREYRKYTDKDLPAKDKPKAEKIAEVNKKAQAEAVDSANEVNNLFRDPKTVADADKAALDAASRTVRENAVRLADLETKSRVAATVREKKVLDEQRKAAKKALETSQNQAREAAVRLAKSEAEVKEAARLDDQEKAATNALTAANKTVRENTIRLADLENKARSAAQAKEKKFAQAEAKAAEKELRKAQKIARDAAIAVAKAERENQANPMRRVWNAVRGYIEKGETDQDAIRTKVATDLKMSTENVYRLLAQDDRTKRLMDDMWQKQQTARRLKQNAKRWVMSLDEPAIKKFYESVPSAMFRAKVFGHMGVAFGTHAPAVGFQPKYWGDLARDYGKMWGMGISKTFYERQIGDLRNRQNFVKASRFGLDNDPLSYEEYNPKGKTNAGGRSYTALKFIRQDIFDKVWDALPKSQQTPDVGWAIANRINHMTGTLSKVPPPKSLKGRMRADVKPPSGAAKALFAPTLLFSRFKFLFGDTIQDLGILTHWSTATPGEKAAVKFDVNTKLWVVGTGMALLTANAGLLTALGSRQKINFTDPTKSDWLKFKAFGMTFSPGNAMLSMARIIPREIETIAGGKKVRADEHAWNKAGEFIRGQMSPYLGTATDLFFGTDYSGRPLPRKLFGAMDQTEKVPLRQREQGVKPYTWTEYASQQASPIPIQEGLKEVWHNGWGMSNKQIDGLLKAFAISGIMGVTGGRVAEDWEAAKKK